MRVSVGAFDYKLAITADNTVWAVIDHNSTFGAGSTSDLPQPVVTDGVSSVPEPSTWALLLGGCGLLALVRRSFSRRRRSCRA